MLVKERLLLTPGTSGVITNASLYVPFRLGRFFDGLVAFLPYVFRVCSLIPHFKTMPNFYYTDANGQRKLVNPQQLKALAVQGLITPDTELETDTGKKGKAGQIKGLFATVLPPPTADSGAEIEVYDYSRIASALRLSTVSILIYILAGITRVLDGVMQGGTQGETGTILVAVLALGAIGFSISCVGRLAKLLHEGVGIRIFYAICMFIPILGLIPLFTVYFPARNILKQAGYEVGFLGADMREFGESNSAAGWVAGIAGVLLVGVIGWATMLGSPHPTEQAANFAVMEQTTEMLSPLQTYRDHEHRFSFRYPEGWRRIVRPVDKPNSLVFIVGQVDGGRAPIVGVTAIPTPGVSNEDLLAIPKQAFQNLLESLGLNNVEIKE